MAPTLVNEIPEISESIRLWRWMDVVIKYENNSFTEDKILHADSNFFEFFSFRLLNGDPHTALKEPNSIVITKSSAAKFFGTGDPMGKILNFANDNRAMKVTGVVQDPPENSHIQFNYLVSFSSGYFGPSDIWISNSLQTYFITHPGVDIRELKKKIDDLVVKYVGPNIQQYMGVSLEQFIQNGGALGYLIDPVKEIHLRSKIQGEYEPVGNINYIYIFGAIGIFILVIASINFMNITTARSSGRAREVGMRKTFGSFKSQLISQFLIESMIFSFISVVFAFILAVILLPMFNELSGKNLLRRELFNPVLIATGASLIIIVGFLAGSYPAFYLTRFKIVEVFKGGASRGTKSGLIRGLLVTFQFIISILLIICTWIVYSQMRYTMNRDLGFDKQKAIIISNCDRLSNNRNAFKQELSKESGIVAASYTISVIPDVNSTTVYRKPGTEEDHLVGEYYADHEHLAAMGFRVAEGRNFSLDFPSDSTGLLVNETLVKVMDWDEPLGEKLISFNGPTPIELHVVGVLKDFNFESLKSAIRPLVIRLGAGFGNNMVVRYSMDDPKKAIGIIEGKWKEYASSERLEYAFLDENFNELYRTDVRIGKLLTIFSILAIFIACLGLFGLASYTAEQRTREIGIRKAMGASAISIVGLLSTEFIKYIGLAFVLSVVPASYFISGWLENFVYRVDIDYLIFILSGLISLIIAVTTVSYQSIKAARINPADTLRYE
ncbi:MAG TPA: FtsX-like permease family protein, partial [Cyclobacteriaceae bacterium]|nr:FtsX-like permease family protein [Cyclobacteriaceae bacterium]